MTRTPLRDTIPPFQKEEGEQGGGGDKSSIVGGLQVTFFLLLGRAGISVPLQREDRKVETGHTPGNSQKAVPLSLSLFLP